jgi:hypothetical protein
MPDNIKKPSDDEPNFIKKDEAQSSESVQDWLSSDENEEDVEKAFNELKNIKKDIRPEGNQQRNLDREEGGLEDRHEVKISIEDVWDKRVEEIEAMAEGGSQASSLSSNIKYFIAKKKRERREIKEAIGNAAGALGMHQYTVKEARKKQEQDMKAEKQNKGGMTL